MLQFLNIPKVISWLVMACMVLLLVQCHPRLTSCREVKNGQFHFYVKPSKHFLIVRQDTLQKEIDLSTGDSSFWKIVWLNECTYAARYLSGSEIQSKEEKDFLTAHQILIQIQNVTPDFYVVKGFLDSLSSKTSSVDTIWMKNKNMKEDVKNKP
jgi:hypothetical protein